ncbi:MAG TPA: VOC family protein [Jatrophihabitans sp.]|jgi:hypothetical protein|uniref:VOC family protein n=1 Tax=Jatrophihabitans sp. TaxID=1932789 RepID=UPI002DFCBC9C|nr:VOC family protein [Jatrophihabitans sp.]
MTPALRQVVLLAAELEPALATVRGALGLNPGVRDAEGMAKLGFEHEVLAIDDTFIEIVTPLSPDSSPGRLLGRRGEAGYMVVLQVPSLDDVVKRAATAGLAPIMHTVYEGHPISQWHPRDLGTLAEIDEIAQDAPWHLCPALSDTGSTAVARDITGVVLEVPYPVAMARRWADVLDLSLDDGATTLRLGERTIEFVAGDRGLTRVRLDADGRTGFVACGVTFEPTSGSNA